MEEIVNRILQFSVAITVSILFALLSAYFGCKDFLQGYYSGVSFVAIIMFTERFIKK